MTDVTSTAAAAPAPAAQIASETLADTQRPGAISGVAAMLSAQMYSGFVANLNLAQQNTVAHQQALNEVGIAITAACVNSLSRPAKHEPTLQPVPQP